MVDNHQTLYSSEEDGLLTPEFDLFGPATSKLYELQSGFVGFQESPTTELPLNELSVNIMDEFFQMPQLSDSADGTMESSDAEEPTKVYTSLNQAEFPVVDAIALAHVSDATEPTKVCTSLNQVDFSAVNAIVLADDLENFSYITNDGHIKVEFDAEEPPSCSSLSLPTLALSPDQSSSTPAVAPSPSIVRSQNAATMKAQRDVDKGSSEYVLKRLRNNISVRKSRQKAREKKKATEQRVEALKQENSRLKNEVAKLSTELRVYKNFLPKLLAAKNHEETDTETL